MRPATASNEEGTGQPTPDCHSAAPTIGRVAINSRAARQMVSRAAIGGFSGEFVIAAGAIYVGVIFAIGLLTAGLQQAFLCHRYIASVSQRQRLDQALMFTAYTVALNGSSQMVTPIVCRRPLRVFQFSVLS